MLSSISLSTRTSVCLCEIHLAYDKVAKIEGMYGNTDPQPGCSKWNEISIHNTLWQDKRGVLRTKDIWGGSKMRRGIAGRGTQYVGGV